MFPPRNPPLRRSARLRALAVILATALNALIIVSLDDAATARQGGTLAAAPAEPPAAALA